MPQTPRTRSEDRAPSNGHRAGGGARVIVVDDEESVRVTTAANLEQAGYEVATAEDGCK